MSANATATAADFAVASTVSVLGMHALALAISDDGGSGDGGSVGRPDLASSLP